MSEPAVAPDVILRQLFDAALAAALPEKSLAAALPETPKDGRTVVVGAGKAAASMARALEKAWNGPLSGVVVTRYGHSVECEHIEVLEAAHPVPDPAGVKATSCILDAVADLTADDLVICLISGGGSALLTLPGPGISLQQKQAVNQALLKCGARIDEMNTVRKHLSAVKGGRLAITAYPAKVVTLAISDVPGDDPSVIASGPTVADETTGDDARRIIDKYVIGLPKHVRSFLTSTAGETPKPEDPRLDRAEFRMIATPKLALAAAANKARSLGIVPVILGDALQGEARDLAEAMAGDILERRDTGQIPVPMVFLSGGETTVTVRGEGRGGRNAEFLLALTIALDGEPGIHAIACDTDGIDGSEDNAGAVTNPDLLDRAFEMNVDPQAMLDNNDGYGFFEIMESLIVTGPTLTNVNDFRAVLVLPQE